MPEPEVSEIQNVDTSQVSEASINLHQRQLVKEIIDEPEPESNEDENVIHLPTIQLLEDSQPLNEMNIPPVMTVVQQQINISSIPPPQLNEEEKVMREQIPPTIPIQQQQEGQRLRAD